MAKDPKDLTIAELRARADELGINYANLSIDALIQALEKADEIDGMTVDDLRERLEELGQDVPASSRKEDLVYQLRQSELMSDTDAGAAVRVTQAMPDLRIKLREGVTIVHPADPDDPESERVLYEGGTDSDELTVPGPQAQQYVAHGQADIVGAA